MKRIIISAFILFGGVVHAEEITINWLNTDQTINHTTTCTIGGDVILPETPYKYGYTFKGWCANCIPVEYLESTGTQWIDTLYKFADILDVRIVLDAVFYNSPVTSNWRVIGINADVGRLNLGISSYGKFSYTAGYSRDQITNVLANNGQRYLFDLNIPNATYTVSDENNNILVNVSPIQRGSHTFSKFYIFGYNTDRPVSMRIYSLQMWDQDRLVRDFIPILDTDNGPCMYDKVENKYYYNQGTGQFVVGPVIGE